MIIMIYDNEGEAIPDFACECQIRLLLLKQRERPICVVYSTENIFRAMLTAISENSENVGPVVFIIRNNLIMPNTYGVIKEWPEGFCDF